MFVCQYGNSSSEIANKKLETAAQTILGDRRKGQGTPFSWQPVKRSRYSRSEPSWMQRRNEPQAILRHKNSRSNNNIKLITRQRDAM